MGKALEEGDEEAAEAKMDEIHRLWQEAREKSREALMDKLSGVLNDDQLVKAKLILSPRKPHKLGAILRILRTMPLEAQQTDQIHGVLDGAADKIVDTLNAEQKEQLEKKLAQASPEARRKAMMKRAKARHERREGKEGDKDHDEDDEREGRGDREREGRDRRREGRD